MNEIIKGIVNNPKPDYYIDRVLEELYSKGMKDSTPMKYKIPMLDAWEIILQLRHKIKQQENKEKNAEEDKRET